METRYIITCADAGARTFIWTDTPAKAREILIRLQSATGLKWQVTNKEIKHANTV